MFYVSTYYIPIFLYRMFRIQSLTGLHLHLKQNGCFNKWNKLKNCCGIKNLIQLHFHLSPCVQEVRESRRRQEQRVVEVDSGVRQDYEFKLAQALKVCWGYIYRLCLVCCRAWGDRTN